MRVEKGVISSVWPKTTVHRLRFNPSWINTVKRHTPKIISGKMRGTKIKVTDALCPKNLYLEDALATRVPSIVAKIEDETAINSEFLRASCKVSS